MLRGPEVRPQRWKLAGSLAVLLFIAYLDRMNISFAIPLIAKERHWNAEETAHYGGLLFSLFYVGYGFANILLSPFAARFGPRRSLITIVVLWSLFTAIGAWASQVLVLLLASRVLLGLAEGVHFPMMNDLTKHWFPAHERSRANSLWISGLFLAVLLAPVILVPVMDRLGWRTGFICLAVLGLAISLPLTLLQIFDRPDRHPRTGLQERAWLEHHLRIEADSQRDQEQKMRGLALFTAPKFLVLLVAGTLNNIVALGVAGWLPTYLSRLEGVQYGDLSYLASLPYATSLIGLAVWSALGDRSGRRGYVAAAGYAMCGVMLWFALSAEGLWRTLFFLACATFMVSAFTACEFAMVQRILPARTVVSGAGLYNGISTMVGGGLGPLVVGAIISGGSSTTSVLRIVSLCALAAVAIALLGRQTRY